MSCEFGFGDALQRGRLRQSGGGAHLGGVVGIAHDVAVVVVV